MFHELSFLLLEKRYRHLTIYRSIHSFLSAMEADNLFTPRRALMLRQSPSIACHSTFSRLRFRRFCLANWVGPVGGRSTAVQPPSTNSVLLLTWLAASEAR